MKTENYDGILHFLSLESVYYSRSLLGGANWGVTVPAYENTSMFHVVTAGNCEVEIGGSCLQMNPGDVVLISRAQGHVVRGRDCVKPLDLYSLPVRKVSEFYETLELNASEKQKTIILCGVVKITHPAGERLIEEMPDVIHVTQHQHLFGNIMSEVVRLMFREANGEFLGGETVITRLADILLIQAIRHWIEESDEADGRWIAAMRDSKIGKVLAIMHAQPEKRWTIESLGREVGMSRTSLANRFQQVLGESTLSYLTNWRMNLAKSAVRKGEPITLELIESLGYQSESAFRRTFKKVVGQNISEYSSDWASAS